MTHAEAQQLALQLMAQHGLLDVGWRFQWSRGKRRLGECHIRQFRNEASGNITETKTIKLSAYLVALNSDEEVRDTILHEIAHAIAGIRNGHNEAWKAVCRRIGCKPQRTAGAEVEVISAPYVLVCNQCRSNIAQRFRRIRPELLARMYCRSCGTGSVGQLYLSPTAASFEVSRSSSPAA